MSDNYAKQADQFLESIGAKYETRFLRVGVMFDDKEERDIYTCKLVREGRPMLEVEFGQSLVKSREWMQRHCQCSVRFGERCSGAHTQGCPAFAARPGRSREAAGLAPTAYDLLACLTKSDPGSFEEFCGEMGLDADSRKALDLYLRVQAEWGKMRTFFDKRELEMAQEIS